MGSKRNTAGRGRVWLAVLAGLALAGAAASADSIWDRREPLAAFLYTDNLASQVGDSLTVLITDQSSFTKKGDRQIEKTTASSGSANLESIVADVNIPVGSLTQESSRTFEGSNKYTSTRQFADSITVTVVDRLPNGNLVVAGRSLRRVAGEDVDTMLTGIVKAEDISEANTVPSNRVSHLSLYYETSDDSDAYLKHGWLNRILNYLWPF
jgi:flagellar L-ring protein precursor FlgH